MQLFVDGQNFYPAMLTDIRAARTSVHIEEYGFTPGEAANMFVPGALKQKASQGVEARLIVDRRAARSTPALLRHVRQAGGLGRPGGA